MSSRARSFNETLTGIPTIPANTFPHFKKPMPPDQRSKLLAMHRAGKVNAGIYVAIVLAVYLVLLTLLLCRYSRKHRSQDDGRHSSSCCGLLEDDPKGPLAWILSLSSCFDRGTPPKKRDSPTHPVEIQQEAEPAERVELINKISTEVSIPIPGKLDREDEIERVEV